MKKPLILRESMVCPICKSCDTVGQRVAIETHRREYISLEKKIIPLTPPHLAAFTIKCLILYHDECLICGTRYLTRAEIVEEPVTVGTIPGLGKKG